MLCCAVLCRAAPCAAPCRAVLWRAVMGCDVLCYAVLCPLRRVLMRAKLQLDLLVCWKGGLQLGGNTWVVCMVPFQPG
jgi:hypothetical protein